MKNETPGSENDGCIFGLSIEQTQNVRNYARGQQPNRARLGPS